MSRKNSNARREGDGLNKTPSGAAESITYKGETYVLDALNDDDFREIEQYLFDNRYSPLEAISEALEAVKGTNPKLYDAMVDRAYRDMRKKDDVDKITTAEVKDYLDTREGTVRGIWMMLRRRHPEITLEKAGEMFAHVSTAEMQRKRDEANDGMIRDRAPQTHKRYQNAPGQKDDPAPVRAAPDAPDAK